jgi:hypothetical protein
VVLTYDPPGGGRLVHGDNYTISRSCLARRGRLWNHPVDRCAFDLSRGS